MSLLSDLRNARTEEDVKDAYIKALGLKSVRKGLVDIQTDEVWFEAKESPTAPLLMFAQLLHYVRKARKEGQPVPGFLAVIDREKAALMPTEKALAIMDDKSIEWPKSGSAADKALAAKIAPTIEIHFVVYEIAAHEKEFIKAVGDAIKEGRIIRTPITPDNLRQVFDKWVAMIGLELGAADPADFAVLFFADIMHDGTSEAMTNLPARLLFNGSNLSAGADGLEWNGQTWSLVNHFIPFSESEVGASARFESDFMVRHMAGMAFSPQAQAALDAGRVLWAKYHATEFARKIRDELKLNRADAGWYQVRRALEANQENEPTDFAPFKAAYAALGDKLRPQVFGLGFLPA